MNTQFTPAEISAMDEETLNTTADAVIPSKTPVERKFRYWCGTCNEFELFSTKEDDYVCDKCSSKHVDVEVSTIPAEKVEEQRNRFRNMRRTDFAKMMEVYQFMSANPGADMPLQSDSVMETDAGLLAIEKVEREKREAEQEAMRLDIEAHKGLGRNEVCKCGSGLKYKKCCLKRIQGYYTK